MSELNWYWVYVPYLDAPNIQQDSAIRAGYNKVVFKSEADKVIAEKDSEIRRLENLCESYRIDCDNIAIREANTYKEIERDNKQLRHNKYKRCLAMAMWCESKSEIYNEFAADASEYMPSYEARFRSKAALYQKWAMRWLELADKFKEAK